MFKNRKARFTAVFTGLALLTLFTLKSCTPAEIGEVLPFDPDIFNPVKGNSRAAALWLLLTLLGLAALFFLFRMFASGGSVLGKTVLASASVAALLLATQVPNDVKLPQVVVSPQVTQAPILELSCLDMGCFDGGGPSLPAVPEVPAAPMPNAGNTGV